MASLSVFIKGGYSGEPDEVTAQCDLVANDDEGNPWNIMDTGIDVVLSNSAQQMLNAIRNTARSEMINAGGPSVPTQSVIVFGGPQ